jgi:hypothetical protein
VRFVVLAVVVALVVKLGGDSLGTW